MFHAAVENELWFGGERDDVRNIANTAAHHPARIPPLTSDSSMAVVNAVRVTAFESAEADFSIPVGRIRHRPPGTPLVIRGGQRLAFDLIYVYRPTLGAFAQSPTPMRSGAFIADREKGLSRPASF